MIATEAELRDECQRTPAAYLPGYDLPSAHVSARRHALHKSVCCWVVGINFGQASFMPIAPLSQEHPSCCGVAQQIHFLPFENLRPDRCHGLTTVGKSERFYEKGEPSLLGNCCGHRHLHAVVIVPVCFLQICSCAAENNPGLYDTHHHTDDGDISVGGPPDNSAGSQPLRPG